MKLLLDTHAFLWWLSDDRSLGAKARAEIRKPANFVFVRAATAWEIAVKRAARGDIAGWISRSGFSELPIEVAHAVASAELPKHHTDPFDRLLIAQARVEEMTLVASDELIGKYQVRGLDAAA